MTGYNLPPGCTTLPGDYDECPWCDRCGKDFETDCECPECETCGEAGCIEHMDLDELVELEARHRHAASVLLQEIVRRGKGAGPVCPACNVKTDVIHDFMDVPDQTCPKCYGVFDPCGEFHPEEDDK